MIRLVSLVSFLVLLFDVACAQSGKGKPPGEPKTAETRPAETQPVEFKATEKQEERVDAVADEPTDLSEWLEHYYLRPEPDRIPWCMKELIAREVLQNDNAKAPVVAFLGQVFAAHPERLSEWFPVDARIFGDERASFYSALWQAGSPEANAILDDVQARGSAELRESLAHIRSRQPRPILELPITSPARLDMLWGSFFATGDAKYVESIVAVLRWNDPDAKRVIIRKAAVWSLSSNAESHERVYRLCKEHASDENELLKNDLEKIVQSASRYWEKSEP